MGSDTVPGFKSGLIGILVIELEISQLHGMYLGTVNGYMSCTQ